MIQMKTYMMTLKRMMMMALLLMVTVSAMAAEQNIWLRITGNGKAQVSLDGKALTFDKDNKATVKGAEGLKVAVSVKPDNGYTVKSVTAQLTIDAGKAETRGADDASFLEVEQNADGDYIFTMPDADYNVVINVILTFESSRKGIDISGITIKGGDFSGTYYIAYFGNNKYDPNNPANTDNHYWCPVDCSGSWKAWFKYNDNPNYDNYTTTENTGMEFLTTYRFKNDPNYNSLNAVWVITKHETIANAYYIQHRASEKYLTLNDYMQGTSNAGQNRLRVHIQSTKAPDNKSVFTIKMSNGYFLICPYTLDGTQWINMSTDPTKSTALDTDANSLVGTDTKGGVNGLKVGGTMGYYSSGDGDPNSKWYLEDYIKRPTIGFDASGNIKITNNDNDELTTVYYSIGGDSDPKTSGKPLSGTTETLTSFEDGTIIKAVAKVDNEYSNVVTFTAYVHVGNTNQYLIQTVDGGSFYMVPPITTETNVTTTNIPHEKMAWYFDYVGQEWGVQYYNIINANTSTNLYCSGNKSADKAFKLKDTETDANRYTFAFVTSEDGVNVIPNIFFAETSGRCMSKKNGNNATDYLNLSNGDDDNSRWKFVSLPEKPKTLFDASFASTSSSYKPYQIQSASATTTHLVPPSEVGGNLIASTAEGNIVWSFEDTGESDEWVSYYYLRNRTTGDYVYFDETTENEKKFLTSTDITSGSEDKFKFIVVKAANVTYTDSYNIIPKILKDNVNQAQNSLSNTMKTLNSRGVNGTLWKLVETNTFTVLPPAVTYGSGVVSMSSATPGVDIKYTTGTSDPSTVYDDANKPAYADDAQIYIKAVAVVENNTSSDITFIKNPDITFTEGNEIPYAGGTAVEPTVSSVTITPEGGSAITINNTEYSVAYSNNTDVGVATATISDALPENNIIISGTSHFTITPKSLGDGTTAAEGILITVTKTQSGETYTYSVTVENGTIPLTENTDYTLSDVTVDASGYRATITAVENSNYSGGAKIIYVSADFPTADNEHSGGMAAAYQASIDLAAPSDLKAYIVTGIDYNSGTVEVRELAYIPKDVPILLLTVGGGSHAADFTASAYTVVEGEEADVSANKLKRSNDETIDVDWGQYYIFSKGEFVLSMGEKTLKAGKFYFENDKYVSDISPAPTRLSFSRGATSVINSVVIQKDLELKSTVWYTIEGQMLNQKPTRKGIYIHNGHKIIVK